MCFGVEVAATKQQQVLFAFAAVTSTAAKGAACQSSRQRRIDAALSMGRGRDADGTVEAPRRMLWKRFQIGRGEDRR